MKIGNTTIQPAQIGIIILTLLTALIHFSLAEPLFILNGLGYLALLAFYFLPLAFFQRYHRFIRWAFAGYTLLTIILYFVFHPGGSWQHDGLGMLTKMIEVVLLLLLVYDGQEQPVKESSSI
jgi:hypothetical protein